MKNSSKIWYQIYPQAQPRGTNAQFPLDGHGNFAGIREKTIPYLASLGVDLVYVGPFFHSHAASSDQYYEVLSHRSIDPRFGVVDEFRAVLALCHQHGIKVMIDMPLCTLSVQSLQFRASADPANDDHELYRDWFIWKDRNPDGSPVNNWKGFTRDTTWRWHEQRQQTYLAWFYTTQANLNLQHMPVQAYLQDCIAYWLEEIGVDGIRLDAIARLFNHDVTLENPWNYGVLPGTTENDLPWDRYDNSTVAHLPETFVFIGDLQKQFPEKILMPEIAAGGDDFIAGKRCLHHGIDVVYTAEMFESPDFTVQTFQRLAFNVSAYFQDQHVNCPGGHDNMRLVERTAPQDADPIVYTQYVLATILAMPGSALIYQGYELALPDSQAYLEGLVAQHRLSAHALDPLKRDGARTPFPYCKTWNPQGWDYLPNDERQLAFSVEAQEEDPYSCLQQTRNLLIFVKTLEAVLLHGVLTILDPQIKNLIVWLRQGEAAQQRVFYVTNGNPDAAMTIDLQALFLDDFSHLQVAYTNGGVFCDAESGNITLAPYAYVFFTADTAEKGHIPQMECTAVRT
jgi:alpha-glucosidase